MLMSYCFEFFDLCFFLYIVESGSIIGGVECVYMVLVLVSVCICNMEDVLGIVLLECGWCGV